MKLKVFLRFIFRFNLTISKKAIVQKGESKKQDLIHTVIYLVYTMRSLAQIFMISHLKKTVSVVLVLIAIISCISIIPTAAVETQVAESFVLLGDGKAEQTYTEPEDEEPVIAETEKSFEDFKYVILDDGTLKITRYVGMSTDVVVPESIDDMEISQIANNAFENPKAITIFCYYDSVAYYYAKQMKMKFKYLKFDTIDISSFRQIAIDKVKVTFDTIAEAYDYAVYYKRADQNGSYKSAVTQSNNIDITLDKDKTYYFYVTARDKSALDITDLPDANYIYTCTTKVPITSLRNVDSGISITWNKVTNAKYYRVYYKTASNKSWSTLCDTEKTTVYDRNVKSGSSYTYTVRALDENKNHISWYDKDGNTLLRLDAPKITNVENQGTKAKITWNKVTGAANYRVYVRKASTSTWRMLGTTTSNTFTDDNLASATTYYYTVDARDKTNKTVSSKDTIGYEFYYLSIPKLVSVQATKTKGEIEIKWNALKGAAQYAVYHKRTDTDKSWVRIGTTKSNSFIDKNCVSGKTYLYTVRCLNEQGNKFTSYFNTSGLKITYSFTNAPELKTLKITSGDGKFAKVALTWGTVPGAYKYKVFFKSFDQNGKVATPAWKSLGTTSRTSFGDYKLKYNYTYVYTVRAVDKNGNYTSSFDSKGISVKPTAASVSKAPGYLVKSKSVDSTYAPFPVTLSSTDRRYAEMIVMGESGNTSYEGMALVAQSLRDAYVYGGYSTILETIGSMGYVAPMLEPNQKVKDCVKYIFDQGGAAAEHRVLVFYATNYCSSSWHESQCFIYQVGCVRYFDMWNF